MIWRSDGADRNFNRGSYKDLAPMEHSLALGDLQAAILSLSSIHINMRTILKERKSEQPWSSHRRILGKLSR